MVLADPSDDIARLELFKPVLTTDALVFGRAFLEFLLRLLKRLQVLCSHVDNFARLSQQGGIFAILHYLASLSTKVGSLNARR